jgi:hypothetical protein
MVLYPRTRRGWAGLVIGSVLFGLFGAWASSPNNTPQGLVFFIVGMTVGSWIVAAWERRLFAGRTGLPSPGDVIREPVRSTRDDMARAAASPNASSDRIIQAGVILAFVGVLIGLPLLFGMQRPLFEFLGDAQGPAAALLVVSGLLIVMVRYADRGSWR